MTRQNTATTHAHTTNTTNTLAVLCISRVLMEVSMDAVGSLILRSRSWCQPLAACAGRTWSSEALAKISKHRSA